VDRTVKDLQSQIDRKEKQNNQLQEDLGRMRDKADKLLKTIDELQASESSNELTARRAERELREEREKSLRLERELEGWKNLRMEKGSALGNGSVAGSIMGGSLRSRDSMKMPVNWRGFGGSGEGEDVKIPRRKSSISRAPSLTKGFL
jgi:myosin protein heavy chain